MQCHGKLQIAGGRALMVPYNAIALLDFPTAIAADAPINANATTPMAAALQVLFTTTSYFVH
jgi:hypothetical protein